MIQVMSILLNTFVQSKCTCCAFLYPALYHQNTSLLRLVSFEASRSCLLCRKKIFHSMNAHFQLQFSIFKVASPSLCYVYYYMIYDNKHCFFRMCPRDHSLHQVFECLNWEHMHWIHETLTNDLLKMYTDYNDHAALIQRASLAFLLFADGGS